MRWSDIPFNPPQRTLRQFAGLWLIIVGLLAFWQGLVRNRPIVAAVLLGVALVVGVLGLVWPRAVRPIYVGGMVLSFPIGWVVSQFILLLMFFGIFTPVALVFRLIGRDALHRDWRPEEPSYWTPKAAPSEPRNYFRQF